MKPQTQQITVDWTRAKGLLTDLKSHIRRTLSGRILLGKELSSLKKKLGFTHGSQARFSPSPQIADLDGGPGNWKELCKSQLGISDDTAQRWICCFNSALERSRKKLKEATKATAAEDVRFWNKACRILEIPANELTGSELEELSGIVERNR